MRTAHTLNFCLYLLLPVPFLLFTSLVISFFSVLSFLPLFLLLFFLLSSTFLSFPSFLSFFGYFLPSFLSPVLSISSLSLSLSFFLPSILSLRPVFPPSNVRGFSTDTTHVSCSHSDTGFSFLLPRDGCFRQLAVSQMVPPHTTGSQYFVNPARVNLK